MELLVAIGLMVILMTAIVMIFHRSTDLIKVQGARIDIYQNARATMEIVCADLQNAIPTSGGQQSMYLENYRRPASAPAPLGGNADGAADYLGLVITLAVGLTYMTATLIQLDLAAQACPTRAAGTVFATLMAVSNFGISASTAVGGFLYDLFTARWNSHVAFNLLVALGAACTALCWVLYPFLRAEPKDYHSSSTTAPPA